MSRREAPVGKYVASDKQQIYRDGLGTIERERYISKIRLIGDNDPYELKTWSTDVKLLPKMSYPDIVNYLVFSPSPYTLDDLKSYKGLEAYNQFISGWVRELSTVIIDSKHVVTAKVLHSQRLKEKPLLPWVITSSNGTVEAAHCTCMAGLGEACTHIGALLFSIEGTVDVRDSRTVTQEPAYWLLPPSIKSASYNETRNIDFSSAKSGKKKLEKEIKMMSPQATKVFCKKVVPEPTVNELNSFFNKMHETGQRSALLSVLPQYADEYIPKTASENFPANLHNLKRNDAVNMNFEDLLHLCNTINIEVNKKQIQCVEEATRQQAKGNLWQTFRAGRITASNMKAVCHTSPNSLSKSLIKLVCYPESAKFTSAATQWGCEYEKVAMDQFIDEMSKKHENFKVDTRGLFISKDVPYMAATPDGIATCDCCGKACIEIKCPFCARDQKIRNGEIENIPYLRESDGALTLDSKHQYYYQVQTQMGVTDLDFSYFVVWTTRDIYIETVHFNDQFWMMVCGKAKHFFYNGVLPELVGKFYSRLPVSTAKDGPVLTISNHSIQTSSQEETWCFCRQAESGMMIACENENCKIIWFHFTCVQIVATPKGKWYCPECKKSPEFSRKRKRPMVSDISDSTTKCT